MRKTADIAIVSNKRLFSISGGIGPINVGTDEWVKGKKKLERTQNYISTVVKSSQAPTFYTA
jgi:hypothetical protein